MITGIFGVPGVGKNTVATMIAQNALKKGKYSHVYTSFACEGCEKIEFKDLMKYRTPNSLVVFDEMGVDADGREFKNFPNEIRDFLVYHRHDFADLIYCTQDYSNVDKKIRQLTHELWYLESNCIPILCNFTRGTRIYRTIAINELTSELILGYRFPKISERIFRKSMMTVWRPKWYKYFDSWELGPLESRPILSSEKWEIVKRDVVQKLNDCCSDVIAAPDVISTPDVSSTWVP